MLRNDKGKSLQEISTPYLPMMNNSQDMSRFKQAVKRVAQKDEATQLWSLKENQR